MTHAAVRDGLLAFWVFFGIIFAGMGVMFVVAEVQDWYLARREVRRAKR